MSGAGVKATLIVKRDVNGKWTDLYWSESKRDWIHGQGTRYKSEVHARQAIIKFKLTECTPVTHG